jgi:hypothetical protein
METNRVLVSYELVQYFFLSQMPLVFGELFKFVFFHLFAQGIEFVADARQIRMPQREGGSVRGSKCSFGKIFFVATAKSVVRLPSGL